MKTARELKGDKMKPPKPKKVSGKKLYIKQGSNIKGISVSDKAGDRLAEILIHPSGKLEVRRFLEDRMVVFLINKDGKIRTEEYEETMIYSEPEYIED